MGEDINRMHADASNLKSIILQNNNIDILLYLAKYNPNVTKKDIAQKFGDESRIGVEALKEANLVKEEDGSLTLTEEGIFQVEGLLTLAV